MARRREWQRNQKCSMMFERRKIWSTTEKKEQSDSTTFFINRTVLVGESKQPDVSDICPSSRNILLHVLRFIFPRGSMRFRRDAFGSVGRSPRITAPSLLSTKRNVCLSKRPAMGNIVVEAPVGILPPWASQRPLELVLTNHVWTVAYKFHSGGLWPLPLLHRPWLASSW